MLTRDELLAGVDLLDADQIAPPHDGPWLDQAEPLIVALTLWAEARSTGDVGMAMVGSVIRNRYLLKPRYGATYKSICLRPYAFSCYGNVVLRRRLDDATDRPTSPDGQAWRMARKIAIATMQGLIPDLVDGAQLYHDDSIVTPPKWLAGGAVVTVTYRGLTFLRER